MPYTTNFHHIEARPDVEIKRLPHGALLLRLKFGTTELTICSQMPIVIYETIEEINNCLNKIRSDIS